MDNIVINLDIEGEQSINTIKELKKHIDSLRDSMVGLTKGSEEWNKVEKELIDNTEHLNSILKAGKKTTDAAAGSYDALQQEMSKLRKEWKATADEAERNDIGQKILEINNQLKEYDASIGNYQRNVGDYEGAFKRAFDGIANTLSTSTNEAMRGFGTQVRILGNLMNSAKDISETWGSYIKVLPSLFKKASAGVGGFTGALKGIKAAIASTGIGLLVIGLGELIANWDKISALWKDTSAEEKEKASIDALNRSLANLKESYLAGNITAIKEYTRALKEAAGDTDKITKATAEYEKTLRNLSRTEAEEEITALEKRKNVLYEEYNKIYYNKKDDKEKQERLNEIMSQIDEYNAKIDENRKKIAEQNLAEQKSANETIAKNKEKAKTLKEYMKSWEELVRSLKGQQKNSLAEQIALVNDELTNKTIPNIKKVGLEAKQSIDEINNAITLATAAANEKIKQLIDSNKKQIDDLKDKYNELILNLPPIQLFASTAADKALSKESASKALNNKFGNDYIDSAGLEIYSKFVKDYIDSIDALYTQIQITQNEQIFAIKQEKKARIQALEETLQKYKETTGLELITEEEKQKRIAQINAYYSKKINAENIAAAEQSSTEIFNTLMAKVENSYNNYMSKLNYSNVIGEQELSIVNEQYNFLGDNIYQEYEKAINKITAAMKGMSMRYQEQMALIDNEMSKEQLSLQRKQELIALKLKLDEDYNIQYAALLQEQKQMEMESARAKTQFWLQQGSSALNQLGGILTSLGDLYGDDLEKQKKLQIAGATVQGLAGMATAVATAMQLGPILGPIIGGINAAMVAASTAIQIAKIKQTTEDNAASLGSANVSASYLNTETLGNALATQTQYDLQSQNIQPIWVSVRDINSVQSSVRVSQNESRF